MPLFIYFQAKVNGNFAKHKNSMKHNGVMTLINYKTYLF